MGIPDGFAEAHKGAKFRIPRFFGFVMKYITPAFLIGIFFFWMSENIFGYNFITKLSNPSGYVEDLFGEEPNQVAWLSITVILLFSLFVLIITNSSKYFKKLYHSE
jgi:SNF family Na+-dependent transporter